MKKTLLIAAASLLAVGAITLLTAGDATKAAPEYAPLKQATDRFMAAVCKGGPTKEAFHAFLETWWGRADEAAVKAASLARSYDSSQSTMESHVGKRVRGEYEFLGTSQLGKSVLKLLYFEKREYSPIPWAFVFYRAETEWKLSVITVGDAAHDDMPPLGLHEPAK